MDERNDSNAVHGLLERNDVHRILALASPINRGVGDVGLQSSGEMWNVPCTASLDTRHDPFVGTNLEKRINLRHNKACNRRHT